MNSHHPQTKTGPLVNADAYCTSDRDPLHNSMDVTVGVDGIVLGRAVVPHGHVTTVPMPTHGVLRCRDPVLQHLDHGARFRPGKPDNSLGKATEKQGAFTVSG